MKEQHERPLLIFDGDCPFCRHWSHSLQHLLSSPPSIVSSATVDLDSLGLTPTDVKRSVWLVSSTRQWAGAAAIAAIFRAQPQFGWRLLGHLLDTWPISVVAELGYRVVAAVRRILPAPKTSCDLPHD